MCHRLFKFIMLYLHETTTYWYRNNNKYEVEAHVKQANKIDIYMKDINE